MARIFGKGTKKTGLPPGTLVHVGERKTERVTIDILDYDGSRVEEKKDVSVGGSVCRSRKPPR